MGKPPKGSIDLIGLFTALHLRLDTAVKMGSVLHLTGNLRHSGSALESEVSSFLSSRIASPFTVSSGYLFDTTSKCTPQIDIIIADDRESHEIMKSDEGASYIPYPAASVVIEVKNSVEYVKSYAAQTGKILSAIVDMMNNGLVEPLYNRPLSLLVIGKSSKARLKDFQSVYVATNNNLPDMTILLDRGIIIARHNIECSAKLRDLIIRRGEVVPEGVQDAPEPQTDQEDQLEHNKNERVRPKNNRKIHVPEVSLSNDGLTVAGGDWAIWEPDPMNPRSLNQSGYALMWFYFAIVSFTAKNRATNTSISDFTSTITADYPMTLRSYMSSATSW